MKLRTLLLAAVLCLLPALSFAADSTQIERERADLAKHFEERGLVGTFVVLGQEGLVRVNSQRAA